MKKIRVGQLINTHGIRGECKVKVLTEFVEERFQQAQELYLVKENKEFVVHVKSARWQQDILLVMFDEFTDIDAVEPYKGFDIMINIEDIEKLEDGYYAFELVGYEVFDEEHRMLGHVLRIDETGANDVLRITRENQRDLLVPFVDAFILSIDDETKKIVIHLMEGLE